MFGCDVFGSPTLLKKSEMNVNYEDQTPCQKYCTDNYGVSMQMEKYVDCWQKCEANSEYHTEIQKVNEMGNQSWTPSISDSVAHPATETNKKSTKSSSKEETEDSDSNEPDESPETARYVVVVLGICAMAGIWALEQKEQFISQMISKI